MSSLLSLSRAARLVGTTRSTLQKLIHEGELPSFDGMVASADLLKLFPDARLDVDEAFERITQIKEHAFGRRVRERTLPSQELLAERLFEQSRELADVKLHLQHYHRMVTTIAERIGQLRAEPNGATPAELDQLASMLDAELERVLGQAEPPSSLEVMDGMLKVMSAQVVLHPSGHEYFVEGADTILEGGLKAGLALGYGCSNGNCGLCKCRVVSGQVRRMRHHDYVLTEPEKQAGYTLACSYAPVSDLVIEALEAAGPDDIPEQQLSARVRSLEPLSDDVLLLHLQTPRTNRLRFLAGQRVVLGFHAGGTAEFPVASCPCDDRNLHFHIARDPQSAFAEHAFAGHLKSGDTVTVWGPWGDFVLRDETARRLLFIACDAGFAPVKSVIEHAMALDNAARIDLVWIATRPSGHYLANLCRAWADALDDFGYTPRVVESDSVDRLVDALDSAMAEAGGDPIGRDVYIAGPAAFVEPARARLTRLGADAARIVCCAL